MNNNTPSYAIQMNDIPKKLLGFMRGKAKSIDLPIKRDEFLAEGTIEWTVGYGKENTTNTFTRGEITRGLQTAHSRVLEHGKPIGVVKGFPTGTPNKTGLQNILALSHLITRGVNAGKRVNALFHCLAAVRRSENSAAKTAKNDAALAIALRQGIALVVRKPIMGRTSTRQRKDRVIGFETSDPQPNSKKAINKYCNMTYGSDWWEQPNKADMQREAIDFVTIYKADGDYSEFDKDF